MNSVNSYFEKQNTKYNKLLAEHINRSANLSFSKTDDSRHIVNILDADNNSVFKAEYMLAGVYILDSSTFHWGYSIQLVDHSMTKDSRLVRWFAKDYKLKQNASYNQVEFEKLYYVASNNNFYASLETVELAVKLLLYLSKGLTFTTACNNKLCSNTNTNTKRVEYLIITKIL